MPWPVILTSPIDCEACVVECPVEAIFAEDDVPEKRKDFIASARHHDTDAIAPGFIDEVSASFESAAPLVAFLCRAVGAPF